MPAAVSETAAIRLFVLLDRRVCRAPDARCVTLQGERVFRILIELPVTARRRRYLQKNNNAIKLYVHFLKKVRQNSPGSYTYIV